MPRPRLLLVLLGLTGVVVAGCSASPDPSESPDERVAAIEAARTRVAAPAQDLGTATATVAARLQEATSTPGPDRARALQDAVDQLRRARRDVGAVDLGGDTPDVVAAADALEVAVEEAGGLADATSRTATAVVQVAEVRDALADIVASWDERGSRSELIDRFEQAAQRADRLARRSGPQACPGPMQEATAAARFVAESTRELLPMIWAYDGTAFDERRAQLDEAPYGRVDGEPRRLDDPVEAGSCASLGAATDAADAVTAALDDLEAALNPPDLGGG